MDLTHWLLRKSLKQEPSDYIGAASMKSRIKRRKLISQGYGEFACSENFIITTRCN
jgi:hypothetical protein